jgi:hypothetical protein
MPQIVTTQPVPNQTLQAQLGGQNCTLNVYQTAFGLLMDVYVGNQLIIAGVLCLNATLIVRDEYRGFIGDFAWYDVQNLTDPDDPVYTGLGSQFQLTYLTATDIASLNLPVGVS